MYRVITQSWPLSQVCSWVLALHCSTLNRRSADLCSLLARLTCQRGERRAWPAHFLSGGAEQHAPRGLAVEHGLDAVASDRLFLGGGFKVGKALLHDRWRPGRVVILSQMNAPQGMAADELINASGGNRMKSLNYIQADEWLELRKKAWPSPAVPEFPRTVPEGPRIGQKLNSSCFKVGRLSRPHFYTNGGRVQLSDFVY